MLVALLPRPTRERGLSCFLGMYVTYLVYLDEFGHIGPYISRNDLHHNDSPVFGLAGFALPISEVRGFGTWFFQRKCELLQFEINRSGKHAAVWEKKGASLYTAVNVTKYAELRKFTFRLFNKIRDLGGFTFHVGVKKHYGAALLSPNDLYKYVLKEAIKRLDQHCQLDCAPSENFILILDEHDQRQALITEASVAMYGTAAPRRCMIEPPFQVESHRYQTMQAADWIAGLVGRFGAVWKSPIEYPENQVFRVYFEERLNAVSRRSGIRD
jgi:hypothetical protein